jgi:hypothetical protein
MTNKQTLSELADRIERAEPNYVAERQLPRGMTCAACVHGSRCDGLFGAVRKAFTSCDFWPSRFQARAAMQETGE